MENILSAKVLVFGKELITEDYQQAIAKNPDGAYRVTVCNDTNIPDSESDREAAFVDLEQAQFRTPQFLLQLKKSFDKLRIIGITDSNSDDKTIEIAKLGVSEVLTKEEYSRRILDYLTPPAETDEVAKDSAVKLDISAIIGNSPNMIKIKKMVLHLADVDYPNAIMFGETGTGKDLLAKVMHYTGIRKDSSFIEVNCSAIPDELFESELFGHKKGAFTDAKSDKTGLFEYADNGTIFLDEIGNLSYSAQAKLLKILENRKLRPLGTVNDKEINVRVMAATNIDLEEAVSQGRFREDLLFRLNLIAIHLPPLRERKEDISDLAKSILEFYRTLYNKPKLSVDDRAIKILIDHHWPGNIRELRNVIERVVLLSKAKKISTSQINDAIRNGRLTVKERRTITIDIPDQGKSLREIEKQVVGEILNTVDWNRSEAARILKISRARLRRIMDETSLETNRRK